MSTNEDIAFAVWNTGEPNNLGGGGYIFGDDEECAEIRKYEKEGNWNDVKCDLEQKFICEIKRF